MVRRVWREILRGKNIDAYLGLALALLVLSLELFGVASDRVLQNTILLLLSLIVLGRIIDRWFIDDLNSKMLGPDFTNWEELRTEVQENLMIAKSVWVAGVAPLGFVRDYRDEILDVCRRRGIVRVSFVQPDSTSMKLIARHRPEQPSDAQALLDEIRRLRTNIRDGERYLQVRCFDYVPSCIITKISCAGNEIAFVTMNSLSRSGSRRPTLKVTSSRPRSLSCYDEEIKELWGIGQEC